MNPSIKPFDEEHYQNLMDGLEANEIYLSVCKSIIDFRIDANTYKKEYVRTDKILKALNSQTIERKMRSIQNFGAYSLCNDIVFVDEGIPFLMTQNIRHNYIDWSNLRFIDKASHKMLYKSHCHKNQVLVTMAGEYLGRVAVYDKDLVCSSNQAIAKITLKDGISPYYVSTFLNSRYGQNQINRFKTITGQPNINMSLIQSLIIPDFTNAFTEKIEAIVKESNEYLMRWKEIYNQAEQLIISELNYNENEIDDKKSTIKSFTESFGVSGRFDAEYYQTKYDDYINIIKNYTNGYELMKDICKIKDSNFIPADGTKYKYIELSNIGSQGDINGCTIDYGAELPTRARRLVKENDVIVSSIEGSLSSCAIIEKEYNNAICSNGFYIINSKKINSETLLVLCKSKIIQQLLKKGCSGTILCAIGKEEFGNIPIPVIREEVQLKIKTFVSEGSVLLATSNLLLKKANNAIEIAIEQGENLAIAYLNK